jgi:hypothetical protein
MTQADAGAPHQPVGDTLLTACGRHIAVGLLRLEGLA